MKMRERLHKLVGTAIKDARLDGPRRFTQSQLADATRGEVKRSTLANIERGRQSASLHQLYVLARALDIEVPDLLPSRSQVFGSDGKVRESLERKLSPKALRWADKLLNEAAVKTKEESKGDA